MTRSARQPKSIQTKPATPRFRRSEAHRADREFADPASPPDMKTICEICTVLIEVPLCHNPPGLNGTPSFCKAIVNLPLIKSRSPKGRHLLHRLWWALKETRAKLANGRKVFNRNDAVVWLIEQLDERA
jgi:hypothetical protein